jgi:thiol:disulfide interchange protein DsbD
MLSRIASERYALLLWIVPLLALAFVLNAAELKSAAGRGVARVLATAAVVYAVLLGVGFSQGATDPLQPLGTAQTQPRAELPFQRIKSLDDLNAQIAKANAEGKTVMLDFYADWCVSCKEMEKYSFPQQQVRTALANTVWLQADVTANDATDQALLKHFGIYGPPTIAFYGKDGVERREYRVVGFMKPEPFAQLVGKALQ